MGKDRERVCRYYEYEGKCLKGREGTFNKACKTCNRYNPKPGSRPRRTDNRAQKLAKINKREMRGVY